MKTTATRKPNRQDATLVNVRAAHKQLARHAQQLHDHELRITVIEQLIVDAGLFPRKKRKKR